MRFLLDTNVLSEIWRPAPDPSVVAWLSATPPLDQAISALTVGELTNGLLLHPDSKRRKLLEAWVHRDLLAQFGGRVLPVDAAVASAWGKLTAAARRSGRVLPVVDGFLLATAQVAGLTLVTRNLRDCAGHNVEVISPWGDSARG